jgi:hypothetical protein
MLTCGNFVSEFAEGAVNSISEKYFSTVKHKKQYSTLTKSLSKMLHQILKNGA